MKICKIWAEKFYNIGPMRQEIKLSNMSWMGVISFQNVIPLVWAFFPFTEMMVGQTNDSLSEGYF